MSLSSGFNTVATSAPSKALASGYEFTATITMSQVKLHKEHADQRGFAQPYNETTDQALLKEIQSTQGARILWGDSACTSITVGGGTSTSTTGHSTSVRSGTAFATSGAAGGALTVLAGDGDGAGAGGVASVTAGDGGATGTGGAASLTGGQGGTTSGVGGTATVTGGAAQGAAAGGAATVQGGAGGGSGAGGAVSLLGGTAGASGAGGAVVVTAGDSLGAAVTGGTVTVTGGAGTSGAAAGGAVSLVGGAGNTSAAGGAVQLTGGAGGATGTGGGLTLTSGAGGSTSGDSGAISIDAGAVTSGTPGTISIGPTNTRTVTIGNTTGATTVNLVPGATGVIQVNSLPLPSILASQASVNLAATGTTGIYTVPTGKSAVITGAYIVPTTATTPGGDAVVNLGTNASTYDNIVSAETLSGLDATTELYHIVTGGGVIHLAAAAETVTINVTSADTGSALTATVYLLGFLF